MGERATIRNRTLSTWVDEIAGITKPDRIHVCDGSEAERSALERAMLDAGSLLALDDARFPRSFLHRSHPSDVARTEHLTFICSEREEDAGPTNNWMSPADARAKVWPLFAESMRGRTMYVVPYLMGPEGSPYSRVGVEITDSPYVVVNMRIMTRMGNKALDHLGDSGDFVKGLHSLGDLDPSRRFICHFPEERTIWSIGSGYGGNALLGKKCHALRLASAQGRDEGWLAEHMLVLGLTEPSGRKTYMAAAFPSGCGKTNLAMLVPALADRGYRIETIGDDICWMHVGPDGRFWAVNPEAGMFGIAPGTNEHTNPNAMASLRHDVIFTNVALTADRAPWWEGMSDPPEELVDWRGRLWRRGSSEKAAHPNSRFTVSLQQCPSVSEKFDDPQGVPIDAILFGGRRAKLAPLVYETHGFAHGVYVGATMVSETTAAATGAVGQLRHDPMAMLPFCGYHMGDYFAHWLDMGLCAARPPKIFHVNWFRVGDDGRFLWPGFGENVRVLQWIAERVRGEGRARTTPIGQVPTPDALDWTNLDVSARQIEQLLYVDPEAWLAEARDHRAFLARFGSRLPAALQQENDALLDRLARAGAGVGLAAGT